MCLRPIYAANTYQHSQKGLPKDPAKVPKADCVVTSFKELRHSGFSGGLGWEVEPKMIQQLRTEQ